MGYRDLRQWLKDVESRGELLHLSGASPELEMSGIAEILARESKGPVPAILYDDIPGYPKGYRTLFGTLASPRRLAMSLGLPEDELNRVSLAKNWRLKRRSLVLTPPRVVDSGPVQENVLTGKDIDLLKFPTPRFHELDGGRYFGTAHAVVTRDSRTGWVNLGTYRNMLVDRERLALHVQPGQHGRMMFDEYRAQKKPLPIALVLGLEPELWFTSFTRIPWGVSEYDFCGGIRGEPIDVVQAPYTGLPVPAHAEIVVEGECLPGEEVAEGPFGEWHGYYANQGLEAVPEPIVRVKTILHRNDPIFTGVQLARPPHEYTLSRCLTLSGTVWDALDNSAVPGVTGVWCHEAGIGSLLNVVSLRTSYAGHSRQAGLIASQVAAPIGRYTIVVDDDVDPSNLEEVMWVVATRADPERAIEITRYCKSNNSDPAVSIELKRKSEILFNSRAIIDACRPYDWKHEFYPIAQISPELRTKLLQKWDKVFREHL